MSTQRAANGRVAERIKRRIPSDGDEKRVRFCTCTRQMLKELFLNKVEIQRRRAIVRSAENATYSR